MPLIIQKYGGKALADPEDIRQVAQQIFARAKSGTQMVVVVSAMGDTTDRYLGMARSVNPQAAGRELDVLLSVGERISIAMLSLALNALEDGIAVSLTGAQAGIITDTVHTAANIVEIRPLRVREILDQGKIPVIAGYQGITVDKNISTLGRGGTDATAVALAISLGAQRVEFMKDVDGLHSADPKLIPTARVLPEVSFTEALEMMGCGAKILQVPAVELAAEYAVPLAIGNCKTGAHGTIISDRPLLRRTLTALVLEPDVYSLSFASCESMFEMVHELSMQGCTPLLTSFAGKSNLVVIKKSEALRLGLDDVEPVQESLSLVTLIGPGVGGHGDLAESIRRLVEPFLHLLRALHLGESKLSVLLPNVTAREFASSAHHLCSAADLAQAAVIRG